jgi:hypothetical protein
MRHSIVFFRWSDREAVDHTRRVRSSPAVTNSALFGLTAHPQISPNQCPCCSSFADPVLTSNISELRVPVRMLFVWSFSHTAQTALKLLMLAK